MLAASEQLPFADNAFDAALSQLVVNFMSDAEAGVREMARVTKPRCSKPRKTRNTVTLSNASARASRLRARASSRW